MDFKVKKACPSCSQLFSTKASTPQKSRLPLLLSCGHPVCESCIRNMMRFTEPLMCKVCTRDMEITPSKVVSNADFYSLFPINVYMVGELTLQEMKSGSADSYKHDQDYYIDLKSILKKLDGKEGRCVECQAVTTLMCAQCVTVLCDRCFHKTHKFHVFKSHALKPIEPDLGSNLCALHKDRPLDYFCRDCRKSVCMDCMMVGGDKSCKTHTVVSAEEMNKEVIEELNAITLQVDEQFRRLTKTAVDIGHLLKNQDSGTCNTDVHKLKESVQNHFSKLHAAVQKHEIEVMDMLEKLSLAEAASLVQAKDSVADNIKKAITVINKITHAVKTDDFSKLNLHAMLEEAKEIVNSPWYLSKDSEKEEDSLKLSVNEDLCALIADYVHVEGNTKAGYRLLRRDQFPEGAELPAAPAKPVYPPEVVKDVRSASEPRSVPEARRPGPVVAGVPQYRSKLGGSTLSVNSLGSASSKGDGVHSPAVQHVPPFTESRPPKPLQEGSQELIYVSHIIDPHNFYVQRAAHQEAVKDMIREFRNAACLPRPAAAHVTEGKMYLALNKAYREWQRCRVLSVDRRNPDRPAYTVFCVDFGSTETVSTNELRLCPAARQASPPPLATHCALANVAPRHGWTTEDAVLVQRIIDNKQAVLHVRRARGDPAAGGTLECDVTTLQDGTSLAHALVFHERCDLVDPKLEYPLIPELSEKPRLFFSTSDYRPAAVEEVLVTHVVSPDKFYVRKCHLQETYEKLCDDLDNEFSLSDTTGCVYLPENGMVCIANLDASLAAAPAGGWRRGVVREAVRRRARLLLADSGETALVHHSALRAARPRHVVLKALATECHLSGVTPLNNKWSRGSVALLERYSGRPLELHVEENNCSKNASVGVTLYDKSDPDNVVCINTEMIKHKFAVTIGLFQFNKSKPAERQVYTNRTPLDRPVAPRAAPKPAVQVLKRGQEPAPKKVKDTDLKAKDKGPIKLEVKILSCQSPSLIYVALIDQQKTFKELFDQLQYYFTEVQPAGKDQWQVGDSCCTVCGDTKTWRRAVIVDIQNEIVKVFYTDFACVESVPVAYLRELPPEFANIGDAAIKCHLSGVVPAIGDEWPSLTKEYLSELIEAYQRIFITKNGAIRDNSLPVELWVYHVIQGDALEPNKAEWRCLNRNIIEQGLGVPDKSQQETTDKQLTADTISLFGVTASARDWVRLEPAAREVVDPGSRASTPDAEAVDNVLPVSDWLPPEPLPAREFTAEPTYVDNSAVIYLHNIEQNGTLELIRKALDVRFKHPGPRRRARWAAGQPCIARFYLDGLFYRGRVVEVNEETKKCIVHYIDYGNDESCAFHDMRGDIVLYQIPTQAHRCRLDRIRPAGGAWSKNSLDYIHKAIVEKQVFVKVSGPADQQLVPIELKFDKLWINDHLVDFDMARYADGSRPVVPKYRPAARAPAAVSETDSDPDFIVETTDVDTTLEDDDSKVTNWSDFKDWNKVMDEEDPQYPTFTQTDAAGEFVCSVSCVSDTVVEFTKVDNDSPRYEAMLEELQQVGADAAPLDGVYANKACLAKFTEDHKWYRASILQYSNTKGLLKVRYVDFGNTEVVALSDVREIREQYLELPPAMISCKLHKVKMNPKVDITKVAAEYENTFLNKGTFRASVVKEDGELYVELRNEDGGLVYENLISQGVFLTVELDA